MIGIIRHFLNFCQPENRKKFRVSLILSIFHAVLEAMKLAAVYVLLQDGFGAGITAKTAAVVLILMLVSVAGCGILKNRRTILQTEAGYMTCTEKRMEIAEHLRYVPMGYLNERSLGEAVSVTTNTMQTLEELATRVIMMVSEAVLKTLAVLAAVCIFDLRVGAVLAAGVAVFALVNRRLVRKAQDISARKSQSDEELVSQVLEYVQGIGEVRAFRLVGERCEGLNKANRRNAEINFCMEKEFIPYLGLQNLIIKAAGLAVVFFSAFLYLRGSMTLVNTLMMIVASFLIYSSLEGASAYTSLLRMVEIAVNKVEAILGTEQMNLEGNTLAPGSMDMEGENVCFSFVNRPIIRDVSFRIPETTTAAIVGPSGGGKSTLTSLLPRFWDVNSGRILLGGRDVREYDYDTLMENFSFVFQRVFLFRDTIANNIRFGRPEAPMEQVIEAAQKAKCHDFIMALPRGYDTVIGEEGVNLSGGERQRISIARAMMKDAPIIILDEATSNVDPENEKELMEAIGELTRNKTIVMIAHRLKTVENAGQILVMEDGHITQRGTHAQLLQEDGLYRRFIAQREKAVSWKL